MGYQRSKPTFEHAASWKGFGSGEPCVLGVDEAGRGPVLGPMVYGIAASNSSKDAELRALGVNDSKVLTADQRDSIFESMKSAEEVVSYAVYSIPPSYISDSMLRRNRCSLNQVSHDAAIFLIRSALEAGINVVQIYVDTVGPKASYQTKLEQIFPGISITVSEKADSKYPVVGAASIAAKVTRDYLLRNWKFHEEAVVIPKGGFGSGYPGDPQTKAFMRDSIDSVFGYPSLVRFSWATAMIILEKKDEKTENTGSIAACGWFKSSQKAPRRCAFYSTNRISNALSL